jgi:hypothetical protein
MAWKHLGSPSGAIMTKTTGSISLGSGRKFELDSAAGRLSPDERAKRGKAARSAVPRESHAMYDPPADRADPVSLLEHQATTRLPDLVPVWYGRMLASPFSYFRGATGRHGEITCLSKSSSPRTVLSWPRWSTTSCPCIGSGRT